MGLKKMMKLGFVIAAVAISHLQLTEQVSQAASIFVEDALHDGNVASFEASGATDLVREAVRGRRGDQLVTDEGRAALILQPRLARLNGVYVLTVEKHRGRETAFAAQSKLYSLDDLDVAVREVTNAAIDETSAPAVTPRGSAPYHATAPHWRGLTGSTSAATTAASDTPSASGASASDSKGTVPGRRDKVVTSTAVEALPTKQLRSNLWLFGVGPFLSRNLQSDQAMFGILGGHRWNLNRQFAVQATADGAFSTQRDQAQMYNFALGGQYSVAADGTEATALIFEGDLGYGSANDADGHRAEGLSAGAGVGFGFFRNTALTLDVLLHASVVFDRPSPDSGLPAMLGVRLVVGF